MNIAELIEILNKSGEQTQIEPKTATEIGVYPNNINSTLGLFG